MKLKSKKIISNYKGPVHDISVENSSSYNVSGLGVHNSAAGCLVSYLIGITSIDPIRYDLIFERFYSDGRNVPEHISFPEFSLEKFKTSV
jgi:hypothetical protein